MISELMSFTLFLLIVISVFALSIICFISIIIAFAFVKDVIYNYRSQQLVSREFGNP